MRFPTDVKVERVLVQQQGKLVRERRVDWRNISGIVLIEGANRGY